MLPLFVADSSVVPDDIPVVFLRVVVHFGFGGVSEVVQVVEALDVRTLPSGLGPEYGRVRLCLQDVRTGVFRLE